MTSLDTFMLWYGKVQFGVSVAAAIWGIAKLSWQQQFGKAMPANKFTSGMDYILKLGTNILGLVHETKEKAGKGPLFLPLEDLSKQESRDALMARLRTELVKLEEENRK